MALIETVTKKIIMHIAVIEYLSLSLPRRKKSTGTIPSVDRPHKITKSETNERNKEMFPISSGLKYIVKTGNSMKGVALLRKLELI